MAKRFSESTRWDDAWYRGLKPILKNFWDFLCMRPDAAGVWKPDWQDIKFRVGGRIDPDEALEKLNEGKNRINVLNNGYWQVLGWVQFQFGENLNEKIGQHKAAVLLITKYVPFGYLENPESYPKARLRNSLVEVEEEEEMEKETIDLNKKEPWIEYPFLSDKVFKDSYDGYIEMRKKLKKPPTKRAELMVLKELHTHTIDIAIKMLDQSVMNSWQGIFPLKTQVQQASTQNGSINYDRIIESKLSAIATKEMIKKIMVDVPENLWWKVDAYLKKRYPGGGNGFAEAEREINNERRENMGNLKGLMAGIGK